MKLHESLGRIHSAAVDMRPRWAYYQTSVQTLGRGSRLLLLMGLMLLLRMGLLLLQRVDSVVGTCCATT
jgi:hypothetical protein